MAFYYGKIDNDTYAHIARMHKLRNGAQMLNYALEHISELGTVQVEKAVHFLKSVVDDCANNHSEKVELKSQPISPCITEIHISIIDTDEYIVMSLRENPYPNKK